MELTGTTPLMMHNDRLANPLDPFMREMKKLTDKNKMTDEDLMEKSRLEFAGGMYYDEDMGPYLPGKNLLRCLREAAKRDRAQPAVAGGVVVLTDRAPLIYDGPRDRDKMWGDGDTKFVDQRMCKPPAAQGRVLRTRPIFPEWQCEFEVEIDTEMISEDYFHNLVHRAGRTQGIGDYRIIYGKFTVEIA